MNIAFVVRSNFKTHNGGDIIAISNLADGLRQLGHSVVLTPYIQTASSWSDYMYLTNTCLDLRPAYSAVKSQKAKFGLIGFHEDFAHYFANSFSFLAGNEYLLNHPNRFNTFIKSPELFLEFKKNGHSSPTIFLMEINEEMVHNSEICIGASDTECKTFKRDFPDCKTHTIHWPFSRVEKTSDEILKSIGLKHKGYLCQIGRLETRKNQIATILATRNLDIPLVLLCTKGYQPFYEDVLYEITKYYKRKLPVHMIISKDATAQSNDNLIIHQTPTEEPYSIEAVYGLMKGALVNVHPAFYELPGLTYLESISLGTPVVAGSGGSLRDYASMNYHNDNFDGMVEYVTPYDINQIESSIQKLSEKEFSTDTSHFPIMNWTNIDCAKQFLEYLDK